MERVAQRKSTPIDDLNIVTSKHSEREQSRAAFENSARKPFRKMSSHYLPHHQPDRNQQVLLNGLLQVRRKRRRVGRKTTTSRLATTR